MVVQVDVLMPVRDGGAMLLEAVEDVLAQEGVGLRLWVIDDGSEDDCCGAVEERFGGDARLRMLLCAGRGTADAIETGRRAAMAEGAELIARMDADDRCPAHRLRVQVAALKAGGLDGIGSTIEVFAGHQWHVSAGMQRYVDWQNSLLSYEELAVERFVDVTLNAGCCVYTAEVLERIGGWRDSPWSEDMDLWLRFFAAGARIEKLAEPLYRWRLHPMQATRKSRKCLSKRLRRGRAHYLVQHLVELGWSRVQLVALPHSVPHWQRALVAESQELDVRSVVWDPPAGLTQSVPPPLDEDRATIIVASNAGVRDEIRGMLPDWAADEGKRLWFVS